MSEGKIKIDIIIKKPCDHIYGFLAGCNILEESIPVTKEYISEMDATDHVFIYCPLCGIKL